MSSGRWDDEDDARAKNGLCGKRRGSHGGKIDHLFLLFSHLLRGTHTPCFAHSAEDLFIVP